MIHDLVLIPSLNTYFKFWCQIIIYVLIFHIYVQPWWNLKLHKRKNSSNGADFLWNAQQPLIEIKIACKGNVSMQIVQNIIKKHVRKTSKPCNHFNSTCWFIGRRRRKTFDLTSGLQCFHTMSPFPLFSCQLLVYTTYIN